MGELIMRRLLTIFAVVLFGSNAFIQAAERQQMPSAFDIKIGQAIKGGVPKIVDFLGQCSNEERRAAELSIKRRDQSLGLSLWQAVREALDNKKECETKPQEAPANGGVTALQILREQDLRKRFENAKKAYADSQVKDLGRLHGVLVDARDKGLSELADEVRIY